jgi:hypothetical protein
VPNQAQAIITASDPTRAHIHVDTRTQTLGSAAAKSRCADLLAAYCPSCYVLCSHIYACAVFYGVQSWRYVLCSHFYACAVFYGVQSWPCCAERVDAYRRALSEEDESPGAHREDGKGRQAARLAPRGGPLRQPCAERYGVPSIRGYDHTRTAQCCKRLCMAIHCTGNDHPHRLSPTSPLALPRSTMPR